MKKTNCHKHGEQGIGLVCAHIANAIERAEKVGFHWADEEEMTRPDAWCAECEKRRIALKGKTPEQWFIDANFKMLCAECWDEAKANCSIIPD